MATTCYQAAIHVLRSASHPLSTREITERAIEGGLIKPCGKTPNAAMAAVSYTHGAHDADLAKLEAPGNGRATNPGPGSPFGA